VNSSTAIALYTFHKTASPYRRTNLQT